MLVQNDVRVGGYAEFRLGAGRGYRDVIAGVRRDRDRRLRDSRRPDDRGLDRQRGRAWSHDRQGGRAAVRLRRPGLHGSSGQQDGHRPPRRQGRSQGTADGPRPTRWPEKGAASRAATWPTPVAAKDLIALKEVQRAAHFLGIGLGSLINVFGPEMVVVGGGVPGRSAIPTSTLSELRHAPRSSPIRGESSASNAAALGDNAGILGAALMARDQLLHP